LRKKEEGGLEEYRMDPYAMVSALNGFQGRFFKLPNLPTGSCNRCKSTGEGNEGKRRRKKGGVS
jgi:hypothetical protein